MRRLMQPLLLFAVTLVMTVAVQHGGGVPLAQAGALNAIGSGWSPANITPGQSANFTLSIFDDNGTSEITGVVNGPGYWVAATTPGCAAVWLISPDGKTINLKDALCDTNTTPNAYLASLIVACDAPGDISVTFTTPGAAGGTAFAPGVAPFNTTIGGLNCLPSGAPYGLLLPQQGA